MHCNSAGVVKLLEFSSFATPAALELCVSDSRLIPIYFIGARPVSDAVAEFAVEVVELCHVLACSVIVYHVGDGGIITAALAVGHLVGHCIECSAEIMTVIKNNG